MMKPFEIGKREGDTECFCDYVVAQRQWEKHLKDQADLQKMEQIERIRTEGKMVRTIEKEKIRLAAAQMRSLQKEEEKELKKTLYEEIQMLENGELCVVTKNLRVEAIPRKVTNMTWPSLTVLRRAINSHEKIFEIHCQVAQKDCRLFLESNSVGSGTYLIRKFASVGVTFLLQTTALQKKFATQLIAVLLKNRKGEKMLPEMVGWMKKGDGTYVFIEKREETWEYVKEKSK